MIRVLQIEHKKTEMLNAKEKFDLLHEISRKHLTCSLLTKKDV